MATYFWDLGFDFNAVPQSGGTSYLQNGFVLIQNGVNNQPNDVPATPVDLEINDVINFNVFNVTSPLTGSYSLISGSVTFISAVTNQSNSSPFGSALINFTPLSAPTGQGPSVICSGIQAPEAQTADPVTFPVYAGPSSLAVTNNGRFLMTASLTVKQTTPNGETNEMTFEVDPEMIVGGAG